MRGAWICVFLAVLTACGTQKVVTDIQRDSVAVIVRDSVIFRDSVVLVEVPKEGDKAVLPDSDTSHLETTIAESVAWVADGRLHHTLRNKDAAIIPVTIKMPERLHYEQKDRLVYNRIVETIEVEKPLNWWERFVMSVGTITIMAAAIYIGYRARGLFS
jgi:hypothetical protein